MMMNLTERGNAMSGLLMSAWRREMETRLNLRRLTEEQIGGLPILEYGVSDIEALSDKWGKVHGEGKNSSTTTTGLDDPKNQSNSNVSFKFLQNAYAECTSCTICIEEFIRGEKLILLPQCGHFFHPQCITPWLQEKKGSCPLCQTMVLPRNMALVQPESPFGNSSVDVAGGDGMGGLSLSTSRGVSSSRHEGGGGLTVSIQALTGSISARGTSFVYIPSSRGGGGGVRDPYSIRLSDSDDIDDDGDGNEALDEEAVLVSSTTRGNDAGTNDNLDGEAASLPTSAGNDDNNSTIIEESVPLSSGRNSDNNSTFDEEAVPLSSRGNDETNENFNEEATTLLYTRGNGDNTSETFNEGAAPLSSGENSDTNENLNEEAAPLSSRGNRDNNE